MSMYSASVEASPGAACAPRPADEAAIAENLSVIKNVNEAQTTIAPEVEEQSATTNEMSRSATAQRCWLASSQVWWTAWPKEPKKSTQSSTQTHSVAQEIEVLAGGLEALVGHFGLGRV